MKERRRFAGRNTRALVPHGKRSLPQVYLSDSSKRGVSTIFHPEPGESGAGARVKWLASTCLAGVVSVCVIGFSIYGSMDMDDGTGLMSSIKHASLAAMKPVQRAKSVGKRQSVAGHKSDRIQTASRGLASKHIIHDSVVQRRGEREYIRIKPYARLVSRLATIQPDDADDIPPFNPFKLYADPKPLSENADDAGAESNPEITVKHHALDGGALPVQDGLSLDGKTMSQLVAELDGVSEQPQAMRPAIHSGSAADLVRKAAYRPDDPASGAPLKREVPANTTFVAKTVDGDAPEDEVAQGSAIRTATVERGDTLMTLLVNAGAERWQAKAMADAMAPVFPARSLQKGQELRFTLMPAPKHDGQMEPVKVSLFTGKTHEVTVMRNEAGEYVVSDDPIDAKMAKRVGPSRAKRATLYTSFFHAALKQDVPRDMIVKLLRVHSYDVDFKQRAGVGDSFEVFYDLEKDETGGEKTAGEVLYTAMRVNGEKQRYYRFRTPDGTVDFYDGEGNSAKKFLMRKPVKGARFTSGFGMRRHPILGGKRMHTGTDWAAPSGTPILAAGNGIVEEAERKGGNGNYVRIRHANGYQTTYSHMSKFASGMKPGIRVNQGQVIGYVGSTGLSTGAHLHFEVLVNSRKVNPMKIHVPRGRQLTGKQLARFYKERNRIDELMRRAPVTTRMASVQN